MKPNKEIKSLTGVRGIAALYVAFFHSLESRHEHTGRIQNFINHGYLSVDLFFILSGYVITVSSQKYFTGKLSIPRFMEFMKKRFARIYPMYFLTLVAGFVVINHLDGKLNFLLGLTLLSVLFSSGFVMLHLWSLSAEWVAYLCYPFLYKFTTYRVSGWWLILMVSLSLSVIYLFTNYNYLCTHNQPGAICITNVLKCFAEYLLGIIAVHFTSERFIVIKHAGIAQVLLSITIIFSLSVLTDDTVIIFLFFLLVISISKDKGWLSKVLSSPLIYFLGLISYSLYLIHPLILYACREPFYEHFGISMNSEMSFNFFFILLIILVSSLTFKFIEMPCQKFLNAYFRVRAGVVEKSAESLFNE